MSPLRYALFVALIGGCAYGVDDFVGGVQAGAAPSSAVNTQSVTGSTPLAAADLVSPIRAAGRSAGDPILLSATVPAGALAPRKASRGLDPSLGLPGPGGATCSRIDTNRGCQADEVCRIATPSSGRCESCAGGSCKGYGEACQASAECDTLFQCWQGECALMCRLGGHDCAQSACTNVGNASYGVCSPI